MYLKAHNCISESWAMCEKVSKTGWMRENASPAVHAQLQHKFCKALLEMRRRPQICNTLRKKHLFMVRGPLSEPPPEKQGLKWKEMQLQWKCSEDLKDWNRKTKAKIQNLENKKVQWEFCPFRKPEILHKNLEEKVQIWNFKKRNFQNFERQCPNLENFPEGRRRKSFTPLCHANFESEILQNWEEIITHKNVYYFMTEYSCIFALHENVCNKNTRLK